MFSFISHCTCILISCIVNKFPLKLKRTSRKVLRKGYTQEGPTQRVHPTKTSTMGTPQTVLHKGTRYKFPTRGTPLKVLQKKSTKQKAVHVSSPR